VQEEERKYIARELHDGTVQTLVALIYQVDNLTRGSLQIQSVKGRGTTIRVVLPVQG